MQERLVFSMLCFPAFATHFVTHLLRISIVLKYLRKPRLLKVWFEFHYWLLRLVQIKFLVKVYNLTYKWIFTLFTKDFSFVLKGILEMHFFKLWVKILLFQIWLLRSSPPCCSLEKMFWKYAAILRENT